MTTTNTPPRPRHIVAAELAAAKAQLHNLRVAAEADGAKHQRSKARYQAAKETLESQVKRGEIEAFDAHDRLESLPPIHPQDAALHARHHRQHYVICDLERELARAQAAEDYLAPDPTDNPVVAQVMKRVKENAQARAEAESREAGQ